MSHLQGTDYVGSMVVFEDGLPKKSDYRRFKVKTVAGNDDYAAMEEVLTRRLTALLAERAGGPGAGRPRRGRRGGPRRRGGGAGGRPGAAAAARRFAYPPQLILIDGGLGQLGWASGCSRELGLEGRDRAGLPGQAVRGGLPPRAARSRSGWPGAPRPSTCSSGCATRPTASPSPTTASAGARA